MPAISRIRFTNVVYENGEKRYNDDIFQFDGHNAAILLENGGGKTVFVQTVLQAIIPHIEVADRKIKNTLMLENSSAHIAIEWILNEHPRRYALTAVTLFINKGTVDSHKYVYEYEEDDDNSIEKLPFVKETSNGNTRPATREEMGEYYYDMKQNRINAHTFTLIKDYHEYIEENFKIIPSEWRKIALINGSEGDVEAFFDACQTTGQLIDNLLIPVVEEALAGNGTTEFIDTFEKQREHFKKHKQLRDRIEESKQVEGQISQYVKVFQVFEEANIKIINDKGRAKGIYDFAEKEYVVNGEGLLENETLEKKLIIKQEFCNQKEASYELVILNKEVVLAKKGFLEAKGEYSEAKATLQEKQERLSNLKVAKLKKELKEYKEKLDHVTSQINSLDKKEDIVDIKESLAQNSSELKGYYVEEEEKLFKVKSVIEGQIMRATEELETHETENEDLRKQDELHKHKEIEIDVNINYLEKHMKELASIILSNPLQDKVEEEVLKWKNRVNQLQKNIFNYEQDIKKFGQEKQSLDIEIPLVRVELDAARKEETILGKELESIEEKHSILLNRIKEIKNNRDYSDSLYSKEQTILQQLELRIENLRNQRKKMIFDEGLAHRYLNDYKDSEYYTAEPLIEKWIKSWGNSFRYIESGTKYIQRVAKNNGGSQKELYDIYPYWSLTIIVFDSEIEKLREKINKYTKEISAPIFIMTEKEALCSIKGEIAIISRKVFPFLWEENLSQEFFENWRKEIEVKAKEITDSREEIERECNNWTELLKDVKAFYEDYPFDEYVELQKTFRNLKEKNIILIKQISIKEDRVKQIEVAANKYQKMCRDDESEKNILENKVISAQNYLNLKVKYRKFASEISEIREILIQSKEEISSCDRKIKNSKSVLEEMSQGLQDIKDSLHYLKVEPYYEEVNSATPKYTTVSKAILIITRNDIKDALDKKQKGRETLENQLKDVKEGISRIDRDLSNFKKEAEYEIDEKFEFPLYGGDEIDRLLEIIGDLKKPLGKLKKALEEVGDNFKNKEITYNLRKGDFYKKYGKILVLSGAVVEIESQLKEERVELQKQHEYLVKQRKQLSTEKSDIEETINELKVVNGKFGYLSEGILKIELPEDIKPGFPYNRKDFVSKIKEELSNLNKVLETQKNNVDIQQAGFIKFCNNEINDIKLKEMAVTGVQHKKLFKDILQWQLRMRERIARTIEIAENDIREHDKEVQQFISHLHSYLHTMAQELRMIPKKTRIKVDNEWKDIFIINVPEWDEKEGKEELSNYIDWMLKQLEGQQYKDENGEEVETHVRKSIEKWMQSKQLLQNIMKQNSIKVKCRKVTNDGKVSSSPYTWEVSNSWSGGEKWSKNMTLFLGILNYLAEKRKNITSTAKRYRTVIVDNPFGKASSDHVLDPVFFIAEQLGFQIIALTAHAEGKFIRTYFPIVYSCRLKTSESNSNVQILVKEREIRKAFFRDSDPQALIRLGQLKQIDMFE